MIHVRPVKRMGVIRIENPHPMKGKRKDLDFAAVYLLLEGSVRVGDLVPSMDVVLDSAP